MKALTFLPLAYVADVQGFLLFAPYVAFFLTIALAMRLARRPARAPARVVVT